MKFVYSNEAIQIQELRWKLYKSFLPTPAASYKFHNKQLLIFEIKVKQCLKCYEIQGAKAELRLVVIILECYCCLTHGVKAVLVYEAVFWQTVRIV